MTTRSRANRRLRPRKPNDPVNEQIDRRDAEAIDRLEQRVAGKLRERIVHRITHEKRD